MRSHMSPDDFRRHGHAVIDWIADYYENRVESLPVLSQAKPGEIKGMMPESAPKDGEPFDAILGDVERIVMPGITHWQSPRFFAFFPANTSGPAILGDLLSSGLGVQGMLWATSPACTEVETRVLDWLVEMLNLPEVFLSTREGGGVIQDTASSATLCALIAARERTTGGRGNTSGVEPTLSVYTSNQAHSSVAKSVGITGLGRDNLRLIDVDGRFAMKPDALAAAIERDKQNGMTPCFVSATIGTTSSNGMDPIRAIGEICRAHGIWYHVDAAMSGTAALCPEYRSIQDGLELADSYCFNPHKWMLTNFDCDCFYVADRAALINSLSITPEYLRNRASDSGEVFDYRDWHVPLGRRFRALKLWFVIRHYGLAGLQTHVRHHVELTQQLAERVRAHPALELVMDPPLNLVCFRHTSGDDATRTLLESLNATGRVYLTHTVLNDQYVIRVSIGQTNTREEHVNELWEHITNLIANPSRGV